MIFSLDSYRNIITGKDIIGEVEANFLRKIQKYSYYKIFLVTHSLKTILFKKRVQLNSEKNENFEY